MGKTGSNKDHTWYDNESKYNFYINSNNTQPVLFETSASVKLYYGIYTRCTNANQQTGTLRHNHPKLIQ